MASKKKQEEARQDAPQDEQKNVAGKKSAKTDSGKEAAVENDTGERKTTRKEKGEKTPTLSEQYKSLKEKHPDAMLLFRSGDFYHTLNEDAKKASDILGITLTKPRAKSQGEYMASFPYHALDTYLPKLIRAGQRVAIADMPANTQEKKQVAEVREVIGKAEKKVEETTAKTEVKTEAKAGKKADTPKEGEAQEAKAERKPREPQMVTVNGQKVSHAHAFQSNINPETWYFTAKLDGAQLRPMRMHAEDLAAYQKKEISVEQLMQTYYPSKLAPKVSREEYAANHYLSDGSAITKMNVYKEHDETRKDYGRYKLYAEVGDQKMSTTMTYADLNAFFDRTVTPAALVERNFGEKLHLASHYQQFKMPEGAEIKDILVAKDRKSGQWFISVDMGERGKTDKKHLSYDDGFSLFNTKTATREQLAAKYLSTEIKGLMAAPKQEQSMGMKR